MGGDYEVMLLGRRMVVFTTHKECSRIMSMRPGKFKRDTVSARNFFAEPQIHWGLENYQYFVLLRDHEQVYILLNSATRSCLSICYGSREPTSLSLF
ncbi:unnamed protein product [Choristocarpus tenellus]